MNAESKFNIISEGQKYGVSEACKKHNISRTLYYRWLKRYKSLGIKGLENITKQFSPVNKTSEDITATTLRLIKVQPLLGPKEIKYRLDAIGHSISESAVYNIMKRHQLSTRTQRIDFARKKDKKITTDAPTFDALGSGECWLFWTTYYGDFKGVGNLYEYTILDYKSRIVCTRLYNSLSYSNFIDLLTAVAIPIGHTLSFETKHLCFLDDYSETEKKQVTILEHIRSIVQNSGFDISIHPFKQIADCKELYSIREAYTHQCLSYLMPFIHRGLSFNDLKLRLQNHIREYNISYPINFENCCSTPLEYHIKSTNTKLILPIWAYLDREY
jgi:transposase